MEKEIDRKKRWIYNIRECQGWALPAQLGQLKTGQDGKGVVAKSSVVGYEIC